MTQIENKLAERDRAIEEIAARLGVRAERGKRFAELTSLRVGDATMGCGGQMGHR